MRKAPILSILALAFILFTISLEAPNSNTITEYDHTFYRINQIEESEFTPELLSEYMTLLEVANGTIVQSQAILETGNYTSPIFLKNNNLFGMTLPRVRETTAIGAKKGHAVYPHWTCSVKDYMLWYDYMTRNKEYKNYYDFLVRINYAEDEQYINKLKAIEKKLQQKT